MVIGIGILFPPLQDGKVRRRIDLSEMEESLKCAGAPMPFVAYLVDRSDATRGKFTSDVCGMKLHGSNVVSSDPFEIGKVMKIPEMLWV